MRILLVITDLDVGGVPLHLFRLAEFLKQGGDLPVVVSLRAGGDIRDRLECAGIEVRSCDARSPLDWRVFERLARIIGDVAPDVVHSLLFHANQAARIAALLSGFPRQRLICEIQTVEVERIWHLAVDRITHRLCRMTVGNSPSVIEHLHRRARIPRDRLCCIPGGVDVATIRTAEPLDRRTLGASDDEPLLIWVGRLDPVKGLDTLLAAIDELRREHTCKLLLVGDGAHRPVVEADIARRGLQSHVTLLGTRSDVPRLLKTADLFVFPSRTEGMPNALLEAMAAGLPIITTDAPGCRDVVRHDVTGLLVPPDDSGALRVAIDRLIRDTRLAATLSDTACHYAQAHYDLSLCLRRYHRLYEMACTPITY